MEELAQSFSKPGDEQSVKPRKNLNWDETLLICVCDYKHGHGHGNGDGHGHGHGPWDRENPSGEQSGDARQSPQASETAQTGNFRQARQISGTVAFTGNAGQAPASETAALTGDARQAPQASETAAPGGGARGNPHRDYECHFEVLCECDECVSRGGRPDMCENRCFECDDDWHHGHGHGHYGDDD